MNVTELWVKQYVMFYSHEDELEQYMYVEHMIMEKVDC